METINIKFKFFLLFISILFSQFSIGQSFNDEKTSMINYVKRMYSSSPFEGAKLIEGVENSYYIAAISLAFNTNSLESNNAIAETKAQDASKKTFGEPCVKFEMLSTLTNNEKKNTTYLFSCQPLSVFMKETYEKQPFDGARIIAAPKNNYFVSVITLDKQKYASDSTMDRVALIKAKQQANALFNGSVISSDIIIKTDVASGNITSIEMIREQSMGFVEGLETLKKFPSNEKVVYIFHRELINK